MLKTEMKVNFDQHQQSEIKISIPLANGSKCKLRQFEFPKGDEIYIKSWHLYIKVKQIYKIYIYICTGDKVASLLSTVCDIVSG